MFRNYFTISFRSLWRNKGFTAINVFGLALGIATCLMILLFVQHELSYDRYNINADRIVRVVFCGKMQGGEIKESNVMPPVARTFKATFPEVEEATRIFSFGSPRISYGDNTLRDNAMAFVDSNFFRVFTLPVIKGDAQTPLDRPNTAVISSATAHKFFGNEDPVGKVLTLKDQRAALTVTAVIDKVPANSHFHFDVFASLSSMKDASDNDWLRSNYYTYLLLREHADRNKLQSRFPALVDQYIGPPFQQSMGMSLSDYRKKGNDIGFSLQPLTDIHLRSDLTGDMEPYGDIRYVYIFSAIAVFMLLIACINFMNLSTAGASRRAKEVGIRKVLGSGKKQLVMQFLLESLMVTAIAMLLALVLVYGALPFFNQLAGQDLAFGLRDHLKMIPALLTFGILTGVLAGSYPAFFLSAFKPIEALKAKLASTGKTISLRSALVVFQFFISIALIIGTTVVYRQLSFIYNKELGYDKNQVVIVDDMYALGQDQETFQQQVAADPRVASTTRSGYLPAGPSDGNNYFVLPDSQNDRLVKTLRYEIDENYILTLGMKMAYGRNFSTDYASDSTAILINETGAKVFGWNDNAVGHTLVHSSNDGQRSMYRVIGVVKDFHFRSLHELITPLVMTLGNDNSKMEARVKTADIAGVLSSLKDKWNSFRPDAPFSYSFLDERFSNTYRSEQNIGRILAVFAALTILVACLGLFGLATFTAERRKKEIGIRKVLGADVTGIVSLLSREFLRLVVIAFVLSAPVAWLVMHKWLQDFAYRIHISWWMFAIAAVAAVCISLITVSFQAIRAAIANPVDSLRSE